MKATVIRKAPETPPIEKVVLELTEREAQILKTLIGALSHEDLHRFIKSQFMLTTEENYAFRSGMFYELCYPYNNTFWKSK